MRTSFSNWAKVIVTVFACATLSATGCKSSGWGWPTASWSSWGKKPATSALVGTKSALPAPPAGNFTPTQSPGTPATGTGLAATNTGSSAYPSASSNPYAAASHGASPTGSIPSSPYGVGQVSGAAAGGTQQGAYASAPQASPYATSQPNGTPATPAGYQGNGYRTADQRGSTYGASPSTYGSGQGYGATAPGYGGAPSATPPAGAGGYNAAPATATPGGYGTGNSGGYGSPYNSGASAAPTGGGYGQSTPTANPYAATPAANTGAPAGGYNAAGSYANTGAQGLAPAGAAATGNALRSEGGYTSDLRETRPATNVAAAGGYRPGSTNRVQPIDNGVQANSGQGVQPATYNNGYTESAPPDTRSFGGGDTSSFVPSGR